jgi:arginine exporter protein ArgO
LTRKTKSDYLFFAGVVTVLWLYFSAICLAASLLGAHLPKDLFWYGLSTMLSGVTFKTILDNF